MTRNSGSLLRQGVCASLLLLALVWTALHVNWQARGEVARLQASGALARAEERMPAVFPNGTVMVNSATVDELCTLRGVGKSLAEAIIAEREANGAFAFPEDLLGVKGIGPKKLAEFVEQICLE